MRDLSLLKTQVMGYRRLRYGFKLPKFTESLQSYSHFQSLLYTLGPQRVNDSSFASIALSLFRFQAANNPLYRSWLSFLGIEANTVNAVEEIPFMPISFFKTHEVKTGDWREESLFLSSGTTGQQPSRHLVRDIGFYLDHAERCFALCWGEVSQFHFLALLPSYLERGNSSLVAMMDHFIKKSRSPYSGFYLNGDELLHIVEQTKMDGRKTMVWGVPYALLDLAESHRPDLSHCLVMETGGMKGKRKEMVRDELHGVLKEQFNTDTIYSEYGMTELFSQAYTQGGNQFFCPPWMKIIIKDVADPFSKGYLEQTGRMNVIDLANVHSIAFIETEDVGKALENGAFEVMGRMDNSDIRGCNLLLGA